MIFRGSGEKCVCTYDKIFISTYSMYDGFSLFVRSYLRVRVCMFLCPHMLVQVCVAT